METQLLRAFQHQVYLQCQFLVLAAQDLEEAFTERDPKEPAKVVPVRVFSAVQSLLTAAANISKALWGQRGKYDVERRPLRESIGVGDNSPLRDVTMRNHFDHFDERIDRWWRDSTTHNYADTNIGPEGMISGLEDFETFRQFDPETGVVIFWGEQFNLRELYEEVERILPKLRTETEKPHWVP